MSNYIKPFSFFVGSLAYGRFRGTSVCSLVFFSSVFFFPFFSVNGVTRTCILGNAGRLKLLGFFYNTRNGFSNIKNSVLRSSIWFLCFVLFVEYNFDTWLWYLEYLPAVWFGLRSITETSRRFLISTQTQTS